MFVAVAEHGSFTRAADERGVSRTRASTLVSDLEAELQVRLLERTTRRVYVTEAGHAYLEQARNGLDLLTEAASIAADYSEKPTGTLRISAPVSFGIRHMGTLVAAYRRANPLVTVELVLEDRTVDLMRESFDIAIRIGNLPDSSLIARKIAPIRRVLSASPAYLAAHGVPLVPDDLTDHDCMGYRYMAEGSAWTLVGTGRSGRSGQSDQSGKTVHVAGSVRANNGDVICELAVAGQGIASLPTFICGRDMAAGRLVRVLPDFEPPPLTMYALHLGNRHVAPKLRTFIEHLIASVPRKPTVGNLTSRHRLSLITKQ